MSEKFHKKDQDAKIPHVPACLNRHVGDQPKKGDGNTCSHRWQAHMQMKGDQRLYDYPAYKSLYDEQQKIQTARSQKPGKNPHPIWYVNKLPAPASKTDWNIGFSSSFYKRQNFYEPCYAPYWHNAHHIIPNSTFRSALSDYFEEFTMMVREGLANEGYNINEKVNMIMLPMDAPIGRAMGLPLHLKTGRSFSHKTYSEAVFNKLMKLFDKLADDIEDCEEEDGYKELKNKLEDLSESLYGSVKTSEAASLDDMQFTD